MSTNNLVIHIKELIEHTPDGHWTTTMNLLLLVAGARNAYYNDFDSSMKDLSLQTMPAKYRNAVLNVCGYMEFAILFNRHPDGARQFKIINPRSTAKDILITKDDMATGRLLGFPCSAKAMDVETKNTITVQFDIITEHGIHSITGYGCFESERANVVKWFNKMKPALQNLRWMKLFKEFKPILTISKMKLINGRIQVTDTKEYQLHLTK